jgi:hypothetical protein
LASSNQAFPGAKSTLHFSGLSYLKDGNPRLTESPATICTWIQHNRTTIGPNHKNSLLINNQGCHLQWLCHGNAFRSEFFTTPMQESSTLGSVVDVNHAFDP